MESAVRFEVARAIGHNRIFGAKVDAAAKPNPGGTVWAHAFGVYAFVGDVDALARVLGILGLLPGRRRLPLVRRIERKQVYGIAQRQGLERFDRQREFRIEISVAAMRSIKEFEIRQQRGLWPHLLDEQGLAPSAMPEHEIGREAPRFQALAGARDGDGVLGRGGEFLLVASAPRRETGWRIDELAHAFQAGGAFPGDGDYIVPLARQVMGRMHILRREIVVKEKKFHFLARARLPPLGRPIAHPRARYGDPRPEHGATY